MNSETAALCHTQIAAYTEKRGALQISPKKSETARGLSHSNGISQKFFIPELHTTKAPPRMRQSYYAEKGGALQISP